MTEREFVRAAQFRGLGTYAQIMDFVQCNPHEKYDERDLENCSAWCEDAAWSDPPPYELTPEDATLEGRRSARRK